MWSSRSCRQLSIQRSATPFCQGLSKEVRTGDIFRDRRVPGTSNPYFASRSKMRYLGADPNGNASRNCWMIQPLVGCFATLTCRMHPTSGWIIQQLREAFPFGSAPRDLIFDRDRSEEHTSE